MSNDSYYTYITQHGQPHGWTFDGYRATEYYAFEKLDADYTYKLVTSNWILAYYCAAAYIIAIFGIQHYMKDKPAFQLKWPLFLWNLGLGIFSIMGFLRTAPGLLFVLGQPSGFYSSICLKRFMNVPTMFWTFQFCLSKFIELGDTVFIVLRKRPLIFLQWYHHLATMVVVWTVAPFLEPISRWYVVLNYGIHSLMYPYFALRAVGIRVPVLAANIITSLQLAQMVIGLSVNVASMYLKQVGYDCSRYDVSINAFSVVYGSFMLLFGKLFYDSVIRKGRVRKEKLK